MPAAKFAPGNKIFIAETSDNDEQAYAHKAEVLAVYKNGKLKVRFPNGFWNVVDAKTCFKTLNGLESYLCRWEERMLRKLNREFDDRKSALWNEVNKALAKL